jgi:hypothetical protein
MIDKLDAEVACRPLNFPNFAKRSQLNIQMPADLDQFG